jgi:multiple sugar transport system permease protein
LLGTGRWFVPSHFSPIEKGISSVFRIKGSVITRRQYWGLIFVLPTVIFFSVFFLYPILSGFVLSLTDFTLLRPPVWVGLQNYVDLFKDRLFLKSISVTLGYVLGSTLPVWVLSLLAALLFYQRFPGRETLKLLFFSPLLPSIVVVSVIWKVLLHPNGVLTAIIGPLFNTGEIRWLNDVNLSPISIILAHDWAIIPFYMLIWLAGLTAIPQELRDAALVDGANKVQSFLRVELPLLRPTAVFVASISTINAFQGFVLQYVVAPDQGGPVDVNTTLGIVIWRYGFQFYRMGDAAAVSVVLFAIILVVTLIQLRLGRSEDFSLS